MIFSSWHFFTYIKKISIHLLLFLQRFCKYTKHKVEQRNHEAPPPNSNRPLAETLWLHLEAPCRKSRIARVGVYRWEKIFEKFGKQSFILRFVSNGYPLDF